MGDRGYKELAAGIFSLAALIAFVAGCAGVLQWKQPMAGCPPILSDYFAILDMAGNKRSSVHTGIDIAENIGYPIIAAADGVVIMAGHRVSGGNRVIMYHGQDLDGKHIYSYYGHMDSIAVQIGQKLKRGEVLGALGNTGTNMPMGFHSHLHFEVGVSSSDQYEIKDGLVRYAGGWKSVNPHEYWLQDEKRPASEQKFIPPFVKDKDYPTTPIRFTYPVPCKQ